MATHSGILAWRIPRDRGTQRAIQSMGSQRVGHNLATQEICKCLLLFSRLPFCLVGSFLHCAKALQCDVVPFILLYFSCLKLKMKVAQLCSTLCDPTDYLQSMEFSRPEYWSEQPFPSPGDLPNPGIKPRSSALQVILRQLSYQGSPSCLKVHNKKTLLRPMSKSRLPASFQEFYGFRSF